MSAISLGPITSFGIEPSYSCSCSCSRFAARSVQVAPQTTEPKSQQALRAAKRLQKLRARFQTSCSEENQNVRRD
jgi:hypothetical protein